MSCFLYVVKAIDEEGRLRYGYTYVEASTATEAKQEALRELRPGEELVTVERSIEEITGWEQMVSFLEEAQIASGYA